MTEEEKISIVTGRGMWHAGNSRQIMLCDGPNGLRKQDDSAVSNNDSIIATCYPTAVTIAQNWDPDQVRRVADGLANECILEDVSVLLGPGVNIKRSPLGGRSFEYYSEDPFLSGITGTAFVAGLESRGVGTSLKHFAGNSQERFRMSSNSQIDERALHEIYLRAFEMIVKNARPSTVMASYNRLNGVYSCQNRELLTDILRNRWGFKGLVVSDWGACTDLPGSIRAGMDLEMPDSIGFHRPSLEKALREEKDGSMRRALDRAAARVEKLITDTFPDDKNRKIRTDIDTHQVAKQTAVGGSVLLKNNGSLPIKKGTVIYASGPLYRKLRVQGGGSSHINIRRDPDMPAALRKEYEVVEDPKEADVLLYFGGLTDEIEGEGYDRESLELPDTQKEDIRNLLSTGKPVIFIAFGGSPFIIPYRDEMASILYMGLPGEAADEAIMELLSGRVSPSGKLAETWPLRLEDTPCFGFFSTDSRDIEYRESIFVGYRFYDTFQVPVQFCFGYGLSYTSFSYDGLKVKDLSTVKLKIKNTGTVSGAEVVQIYVRNPEGDFLRERRSLRGFKKVFLEPGEEKEITISLDDRSFQVWSVEKGDFITCGGEYAIEAGASLQDIRVRASVHVEGENVSAGDRERYPSYYPGAKRRPVFSGADFQKLYGREFSDFSRRGKGEFDRTATIREMSRASLLARLVAGIVHREVVKMSSSGKDNDPEVRMMEEFILDGTIDAAAIQSDRMIGDDLVRALIEDANGHHLRAVKELLRGGRK
ncbi:MAG: glycoside hydrolase family 3 C-terminal domain-containing protein [Eubacteriales bacterium]|nr:glycoside hydrolase family 3 C-terminal domain-containing protein [Eubacteriales bacterium]